MSEIEDRLTALGFEIQIHFIQKHKKSFQNTQQFAPFYVQCRRLKITALGFEIQTHFNLKHKLSFENPQPFELFQDQCRRLRITTMGFEYKSILYLSLIHI